LNEVHVLAIVSKAEAEAWLDEEGTPAPPQSTVNTGTAGGDRTREVEWI